MWFFFAPTPYNILPLLVLKIVITNNIPVDERCLLYIYEICPPLWPYILLKCKYLHSVM